MDYKDNDLIRMMNAIKNLQKNNSNSMNVNKDEAKPTGEKDTSFYSRIFHHNSETPLTLEKNIVPPSKPVEPIEPIDFTKLMNEYVASPAFRHTLETMVGDVIINSVQNKEYMNKLISAIILEYTNNNSNLKEYMEKAVENSITDMIKKYMYNMGKILCNESSTASSNNNKE